MAEKEERILHIVQKLDGRFVGDISITRTEAVERIAKALYLYNREDAWYKEHAYMFSKYMNKIAEAALNALLS